MNFEEFIKKSLKDVSFLSRQFREEYITLDNLNDYIRILLNEYESDRLSNYDLERICDNLENFLIFGNKYALHAVSESDYETKFPGTNLNFTLGLVALGDLSSTMNMLSFSKDDLPTVRACLDTSYESYEKKAEVEEKCNIYFNSKNHCNQTPDGFFIKFFELIYGLWENPEENLVVYSYIDREDDKKNYALKIGLKKMLDIVTNAKLVKKAIPYGIIYEAFSQDDKWLFSIVNEIGNNRNESGKRIYDSHILTDDVELRELLSLFLDVQVGGYLEEFKGYEVYAYGKMNVVNGSRIATDETLLLKNSEVFSSIRKVYTRETYWREG